MVNQSSTLVQRRVSAWGIWGILVLASLFCLRIEQGWGEGIISPQSLISKVNKDEQTASPISSGVYGPFSSDYSMSLFFTSEGDSCWLVREALDFKVQCLPIQATSGVRLGQSDKSAFIQAHLGAVKGPAGKPIPEFVIIIPLADADMDQIFLEKKATKRLLKKTSIFDDICKLIYQADEQPPVNEEWRCSSFLNFWDRRSGRSKFYYELRVRPIALWPTDSDTTSTAERESQGPFDFFSRLVDKKELNVKIEINEESLTEVKLYLTSHPTLLNNLLTLNYDNIYGSSVDTSAEELVGWIIGPFSNLMCTVKRFADFGEIAGRNSWDYTGKFLVDCDHLNMLMRINQNGWFQYMKALTIRDLSPAET